MLKMFKGGVGEHRNSREPARRGVSLGVLFMKTKYAVLGTVSLVVASVGLWVGHPQAQAEQAVTARVGRIQQPEPTDNLLAHALVQSAARKQDIQQSATQSGNKVQAGVATTKAVNEGSAATAPAGQANTSATAAGTQDNQVNAGGGATSTTSSTTSSTTQVTQPTTTQSQSATSAPQQSSAGPSISFLGITMPVIQGNMSVTTAPAGNLVETWGGQTRLSVSDGQSTHIIGHNTSSFGAIIQLGVGSAITVTDVDGQVRTYHVTSTADVNDQGYDIHTGQDEWNHIVSAGQGEQIVLQTCLSGTINRLVWAR